MQLDDFDYHLPDELIAQQPLLQRSASRLLQVQRDSSQLVDYQFIDLMDLLIPGDLLVMNNTRVLPARLFAHKDSGGKVELLLERLLSPYEMLAQVRANRPLKVGAKVVIDDTVQLESLGRQGEFYHFKSHSGALEGILKVYGQMPLPPYISRSPSEDDNQRYQTVYADVPGAVAAPTAGLHFDQALLDKLKQKGIASTHITLHVGAGTFQPVRIDDVKAHKMHAEYLEVSDGVCAKIQSTKANGGRVIAIGTTTVRALETAAADGQLKPYQGDSRLFIYPGFQFKVIDAMLTNFHLPKSTLLMLVSAFAGRAKMQQAYAHAIEQRYRFFSYGDAMLIV